VVFESVCESHRKKLNDKLQKKRARKEISIQVDHRLLAVVFS
jgi:hypothetical protein